MSDSMSAELVPTDSLRLGGWRVGPMLACGGMGMVFFVRHDAIQSRRGVLKVMRPGGVSTLGELEVRKERFTREAEVLARLRHRGCPQLLDFGHGDDGMPYMVQEHVEGDTLDLDLYRSAVGDVMVRARAFDDDDDPQFLELPMSPYAFTLEWS